MRAVIKREFFSAFRRYYGYVAVAVPVILSAFLLMTYNLMYSSEDTVAVYSAMTLVISLIIPVVAISSFSKGRKGNADTIYDMLPVSSFDVVVGKYLSSFIILLVSTAVMAVYPVIAGAYATVDMKASYNALLGYVLFEAALLAVCTFIASKAKKRLIAYVVSYVVIIVWYFAGLANVIIPVSPIVSLICFSVIAVGIGVILYIIFKNIAFSGAVVVILGTVIAVLFVFAEQSFSGLFELFIDKLSVFRQFDSFSYGIFDIEGIVFMLSLVAVFVFLSCRTYEKKYESIKQQHTMRITKITSAMLAVTVVATSLALNVFALVLPDIYTSFDATTAKKSSVSESAKEYLETVDKPVTMYLLESSGDESYELYLESLAGCNDNITIEKIFYANTPEFYTERGIGVSSVSADSVIIECEQTGRFNYIAYSDMIVYSNESLGLTQMGNQEYSYYYSMFSSNESYAEYLNTLITGTVIYFNGDYMLCSYIEYAVKDIIPSMYCLTGHGEKDMGTGYFTPLTLIDAEAVPADASCILINLPSEDITSSEKEMLLDYLSGGGQITVLTEEENLDMPNLCAVLAAYGMSADKGVVTDVISDEENENDTPTTDINVIIDGNNDILYEIVDAGVVELTVSDANAIKRDSTVKDTLEHYPLLITESTSYIGDGAPASYTVACAAETSDGAKLVWFTGGESFQSSTSNAMYAVMYAASWVTLEYESAVADVPATVLALPSVAVTSGGARLTAVLLMAIPLAVMVGGGIIFYARKKK